MATNLKAKYSAILRQNDIHDEIVQITVRMPDLKDQHMASVIEIVCIEFQNAEENLELFVKKRIPLTDSHSRDDHMNKAMLREGIFLHKFIPELKKFCSVTTQGRRSSIFIHDIVPKAFYVDEEMIIMENLTKQGYAILPRKQKLDFNHSCIALQYLSQLHAASYVQILNDGGIENFLARYPQFEEMATKPELQDEVSQSFEPLYEICLNLIQISSHEGKKETYDCLKEYKGKLAQTFCDVLKKDNLLSVVCHGDFWSNNIMFDKTCTKIVLVDFQLARVGSPSTDLSFFLFSSVKPEVRKRWKVLLQTYVESFKSNVECLGHTVEFKFEDFVNDFVRKSKVGFFFAFGIDVVFDALGSSEQREETSNNDDGKLSFADIVHLWTQKYPDEAKLATENIISAVNDYLLFGQL